jgi:hypothetical protein
MANTHESARESAARARDALAKRDAEKAAKSVPTTRDVFADAAERARRENWSRTPGPRETD